MPSPSRQKQVQMHWLLPAATGRIFQKLFSSYPVLACNSQGPVEAGLPALPPVE